MSNVPILYTYRYMWNVDGDSDLVKFKIVTDTVDGLKQFEEALLNLDGLNFCGKEYICEYSCDKIGLFERVFKKEEK